jgi:hypothetical protein
VSGAALSLRKASVSLELFIGDDREFSRCPERGIASFGLDALDVEWRTFMSRDQARDNSHSGKQVKTGPGLAHVVVALSMTWCIVKTTLTAPTNILED